MTRIGDPEPEIADDPDPGEELYETLSHEIQAAPLALQLELATAFEGRKPFGQLSPELRDLCARIESALFNDW